MQPAEKSQAVNDLMNTLTGDDREATIKGNRCTNPPIGCGEPIKGFKDEVSIREYKLTGMCQDCQDKTYDYLKKMEDMEEDYPV